MLNFIQRQRQAKFSHTFLHTLIYGKSHAKSTFCGNLWNLSKIKDESCQSISNDTIRIKNKENKLMIYPFIPFNMSLQTILNFCQRKASPSILIVSMLQPFALEVKNIRTTCILTNDQDNSKLPRFALQETGWKKAREFQFFPCCCCSWRGKMSKK